MAHRIVPEQPAAAATAAADPLHRYQAKRNFALTSEPRDGCDAGDAGTGRLSFVVQKHWASSLHYDFRLEFEGTMKSWAVPKGPSLDPAVKRMAVQVEDHPVSYSTFEGTIAAGQYGAGKVIVWDTGHWQPVGDAARGFSGGHLKFTLHGCKLQGKWVLVRMKGRGEKQAPWLLIKEKDAFARAAADFSVVDELPDSVTAASARPRPASAAAPKTALPAKLLPQLATLAETPPADPANWVGEIKFDGYRLLARVDGPAIGLFTRNGNDWTSRLAPLREAIAALALPAGWYDGEIVLPGERGVPDFGALQRAFEARQTGDIVFYVFDLPFFDGRDMRLAPLEERRAVLERVIGTAASERVRLSDVFDGPLASVLGSACKLGLEGIVAKRRGSAYRSGRSADWIKLKCGQRQEFVVGGYTDPQGARGGFGALLLGVHDEAGSLRYAGKVGTGFGAQALQSIAKRLAAMARASSPFAEPARFEGKPHWVAPTLVAEVSFAQWTLDGHLRHAVFHGLRDDKPAGEIVREQAGRVKPSPERERSDAVKATPSMTSRLHVTNPDRVIDASTGTTKIELVRYYALVGDLAMAHLKGRPVSLVRAPQGVGGELFFQKHADTTRLPGVRQLDPALYLGHPAMLEVFSQQGLLSAAQWNTVEFHTLNTRATSFAHPDRMVFDLDPGEGVAWAQVQQAAELTRAFLSQLGLVSFLKTSGGKGLHVVVPLRRSHDWDTVKGFAQAVVVHMARTVPQRFVAKSGPKNRVGKVFIDYLRNGLGATTVCAWSARARPGLGISVPVEWSELQALKSADQWTVRNVHTRLAKGNEPWKKYNRSARGLNNAMKALGFTTPAT